MASTRIDFQPSTQTWTVFWEVLGCVHGGHHFNEQDAIDHAERLEIEAAELAILEEAAETGRSSDWVRELDRLGVA